MLTRRDFIENRKNSWLFLSGAVRNPRSSDLYTNEHRLLEFIKHYRRTIADLSLARTLFHADSLVRELNILVCNTLHFIGRTYQPNRRRIARFFQVSLPETMLTLRGFFIISFIVFFGSAAFGYFVSTMDPVFTTAMIGDKYVYMTIDNITSGEPFAVYQSKFKYAMSSFIMSNNIKVSFTAFSLGVFYGVGTFLVLLFNGLMLGGITALFGSFNLLLEFVTTVMVHGTLELFAIVVAGAAGLRFGQSIFRPGTLKRREAVKKFGIEAFYITTAMVPVLVIAGILEGYVTPLNLPLWGRCGVILASALFLVIYLGTPLFLYLRRNRQPVPEKPLLKLKLRH